MYPEPNPWREWRKQSELRTYVKLRCAKEARRAFSQQHLAAVQQVTQELVTNDPHAQEVFRKHNAALEGALQRRATTLLQDNVVKADLAEACRRDNEARMARLEKRYASQVAAAEYFSVAAMVMALGAMMGLGYVCARDERR